MRLQQSSEDSRVVQEASFAQNQRDYFLKHELLMKLLQVVEISESTICIGGPRMIVEVVENCIPHVPSQRGPCHNPTVVLELLGNNPKREQLVISKRNPKQLEDLKLLNILNFPFVLYVDLISS